MSARSSGSTPAGSRGASSRRTKANRSARMPLTPSRASVAAAAAAGRAQRSARALARLVNVVRVLRRDGIALERHDGIGEAVALVGLHPRLHAGAGAELERDERQSQAGCARHSFTSARTWVWYSVS